MLSARPQTEHKGSDDKREKSPTRSVSPAGPPGRSTSSPGTPEDVDAAYAKTGLRLDADGQQSATIWRWRRAAAPGGAEPVSAAAVCHSYEVEV